MNRSSVHERLGFKSAQIQFDQRNSVRNAQEAFFDGLQQNQNNMYQNQLFNQGNQHQSFSQGNPGYPAREIQEDFRSSMMRNTLDVDRRMSLNIPQSATRGVPSVLDLDFGIPLTNVDRVPFNRSASPNSFNSRSNGRSQLSQAQRGHALKRPRNEESFQGFQNSSSFKRSLMGQEMRKANQGSSFAEMSAHNDKSKFGCKVCRVQFVSLQEFDDHMASQEHSAKIGFLSTVYKDTNQQVRTNFKSTHTDQTNSRGNICTVCDRDYGNYSKESHLRTAQHKNRLKLIQSGCKWCSVDRFTNFTHYLNHLSTKVHKENKMAHSTKTPNTTCEKVKQPTDVVRTKVENTKSDDDVKVVEVEAEVVKPLCEEVITQQTLDDLKFDSSTAVGVSVVIPVTGYFCKLCHKFYNNETMARDSHCKSQAHFDKYYEFIKKKLLSVAMVKSETVALATQEVTVPSEERLGAKPSNKDEHTEVQSEPATVKSNNTAVRGRGRGRAAVRGRR